MTQKVDKVHATTETKAKEIEIESDFSDRA